MTTKSLLIRIAMDLLDLPKNIWLIYWLFFFFFFFFFLAMRRIITKGCCIDGNKKLRQRLLLFITPLKIYTLNYYYFITNFTLPCGVLDMTLIDLMVGFSLGTLGIAPSLPLLPCPLLSRVIVPNRVPSISQIELFDHLTVCKQMTVKLNCSCYIGILGKHLTVQMNYYKIELLASDNNIWNHLTMCKQIT